MPDLLKTLGLKKDKGFYNETLKPFYDKEIAPYTSTLDTAGYATNSTLGALLGYLYDKYVGGNSTPGSAVVSTVGGALAGAGAHTVYQILKERARIKANKKLPRSKRIAPDGSLENPPVAGKWALTGLSTLAGGAGGYKAGTGIYNAVLKHKLKSLTAELDVANKARSDAYNDVLKALNTEGSLGARQYVYDNKSGGFFTNPNKALNDSVAKAGTNRDALEKILAARNNTVTDLEKRITDIKALRDQPGFTANLRGKPLIQPDTWYKRPLSSISRLRAQIGNRGKLIAGGAGALALGSLAYLATNPGFRKSVATRID